MKGFLEAQAKGQLPLCFIVVGAALSTIETKNVINITDAV